jgi:hypothetical protein
MYSMIIVLREVSGSQKKLPNIQRFIVLCLQGQDKETQRMKPFVHGTKRAKNTVNTVCTVEAKKYSKIIIT